MSLKPGLYEQVVTEALRRSLSELEPALVKAEHLDEGESHDALAEHIRRYLSWVLKGISGPDKLRKQVEISNQIIGWLADTGSDDSAGLTSVDQSAEKLLSVLDAAGSSSCHPERPDTPLSRGCILTGTRLDPSLESQIKKEIKTADRVDILCSFIKWSGIRTLEDDLKLFTQRPGTRLRVITTSYLGATDLKAIEFLRQLPGTEIRVSYDTRRTRLHAKAYAFHRSTKFGTAYVGSANLSRPALTEGLEWNVKVSQYESPHLWDKVTAAFETYWNDREFASYTEEERPRLQQALQSERGKGADSFLPSLDVRPYPFQQEILDHLEAESKGSGDSGTLWSLPPELAKL